MSSLHRITLGYSPRTTAARLRVPMISGRGGLTGSTWCTDVPASPVCPAHFIRYQQVHALCDSLTLQHPGVRLCCGTSGILADLNRDPSRALTGVSVENQQHVNTLSTLPLASIPFPELNRHTYEISPWSIRPNSDTRTLSCHTTMTRSFLYKLQDDVLIGEICILKCCRFLSADSLTCP